MSAESPLHDVSPAFKAAYLRQCDSEGRMRFDRFVELALYDAEAGYYRADRTRVGRTQQSDFYTATSSGPLFGELVVAACRTLLAPESLEKFSFVEVGAEPGGGVLKNVNHDFGSTRTVKIGEPLELSGKCVVFSNELFDAQPFRRLVRKNGAWEELGVRWNGNHFEECTWPHAPDDLNTTLPSNAPEGYHLDLSPAAEDLAERMARQPWHGLFLAFDYGKTWAELTTSSPQGTARAYFRHQQEKDLLARPGKQDLTVHVCWDFLTRTLRRHGFMSPEVQSQEAFFIHHAAGFIADVVAAEAARLSPRKMGLMQLLHPANMGQKFQVLWAVRSAEVKEGAGEDSP
jgi:SAM-dependent MidA family methyltransferase